MRVDPESLARLCPRPRDAKRAAIWDGYVNAISDAGPHFRQFEVVTGLRWCHLVATWAHETGGFTILWESGAYSAERIVQIFGAHRHSAAVSPQEAARLAGNAYALFERVYGLGNTKMARMLGNTQPGDGYRFRGLGIQQITGRAAHERYAGLIRCTVDELADPNNAVLAALLEWREKGCNAIADRDDVVGVRRKINGGTNGLDDVRQYVAKAKRIWSQGIATGAAVAGSNGVVAGAAAPVLQLGDGTDTPEGDPRVRALQHQLSGAGYQVGMPDGRFGALTERAVSGFQVAHGLPGTGKVDEQTWAAVVDAAPVDAVPGRDQIDERALAERGDPELGYWKAKRTKALTWMGVGTGSVLDKVFGLGVIDSALDKIEQAQSIGGRLSGILGALANPRVLITLAVFAFALWGLVQAARGIAGLVAAVKRGAKLGGAK